MMKIVVRGQIPQHRLAMNVRVVAEEQIVRLLTLSVKEGVVVVALEAFDHVPRMAAPLVDLPIRRHRVDQVRSTVLYCNHIAMGMVPVDSDISRDCCDMRRQETTLHIRQH